MALITKQELEDAAVDAQTLEDVANGSATLNGTGEVTSRLGQTIKTIAKVIEEILQYDISASLAADIVNRIAERTNYADNTAFLAATSDGDYGYVNYTLTKNVGGSAVVQSDDELLSVLNSLNSEISTRSSADTNLQTNIDNEETARQAADTTLQSNIDTEQASREAADVVLQDNIDAEEASRELAIKSVSRLFSDYPYQQIVDSAYILQETSGNSSQGWWISTDSPVGDETEVSNLILDNSENFLLNSIPIFDFTLQSNNATFQRVAFNFTDFNFTSNGLVEGDLITCIVFTKDFSQPYPENSNLYSYFKFVMAQFGGYNFDNTVDVGNGWRMHFVTFALTAANLVLDSNNGSFTQFLIRTNASTNTYSGKITAPLIFLGDSLGAVRYFRENLGLLWEDEKLAEIPSSKFKDPVQIENLNLGSKTDSRPNKLKKSELPPGFYDKNNVELFGFDKAGSAHFRPAERVSRYIAKTVFGNEYPTADELIVCWGDSLTQGAGSTIATYPEVLASELGREVINKGIGGQVSEQIAARQGGAKILVTLTSNQIPASGGVVVTDKNINVLYQGGFFTGSQTGFIYGVHGTMTTDGSGNWTFTRDEAGIAVDVPADTEFVLDDHINYKNSTVVIWSGRNDSRTGREDYVATRDYIISMVEFLNYKFKNVIILNVLNGSGETSGSSGYLAIEEVNKELATNFANQYSDLRSYLVNYAIYDAGLTPTAQDLTDIGNDVVPDSLRSDGIHLNDTGYEMAGKFVARQIKARGL